MHRLPLVSIVVRTAYQPNKMIDVRGELLLQSFFFFRQYTKKKGVLSIYL